MKRLILTILLALFVCPGLFAADHEAASLTYTDINTALALCSPGDRLILPAGDTTSDWSSILIVDNGIDIIGQGSGSTIIRNSTKTYYMIYINYNNAEAAAVEISGFSLYGVDYNSSGAGCIKLYHCEKIPDIVIHDVHIESFNGVGINFSEDTVSGLVYDCSFKNIYPANLGSTGYGICIYGDGTYDDPIPALGSATMLFVEDCTFEAIKHSVACLDGAHVVIRYNTMSDPISNRFICDVHGYQSGSGTAPGNTWEIYNNTMTGDTGVENDEGLGIRGGTGVIFNNVFYDFDEAAFPGSATAHKAIRISSDDSPASYHPGEVEAFYVWNNTLEGSAITNVSIEAGTQAYVVLNTDYFMSSKGGYTAYTYPHPSNAANPPQADFPDIYIDASVGAGGTGAQTDPYDELSDINWTTGGNNSVFDYYAGTPTASVTTNLKGDETWAEQMTVGASGTAPYPIRIRAYGTGAGPIITGSDARNYCIDTNGNDYIIITGLDLRDATVANVLLDGTNQSDLNYCIVTGGVAGVEMDTAASNIQNCVIYDCTNGVDVDAAGDIKNSIIRNCTDDLDETGASINKTTNNIEDDGDADPLMTNPGLSEYITNGGFAANTTGWIAGNAAAKASVAGGQDGNCLQITCDGTDDPYVVQNVTTVPGDKMNLTVYVKQGTESTYHFTLHDQLNGSYIYQSGDQEATGSWVAQESGEFTVPALCTIISVYFQQKATAGAGTTILFDEASLVRTDRGPDDYTLQFGSPCINRGTHVGLFLDYRGTGYPVPIGHRPDIGAYEHKNGGVIFEPLARFDCHIRDKYIRPFLEDRR